MKEISIQPLTAAAFAPFGDVLECAGAPDKVINQGLCGRFHDRACPSPNSRRARS
ncbi:MAG: ureidoglycolate lyase, partial [Pseudomonadota bacterium]